MAINFISFKDSKDLNKNQTINLKSDSTETVMGSETDEIVEELFESLLQKYQELEVILFLIVLIHCLSRGGSYIDSPKRLKNKKTTVNPKNNDNDKCFQYALTAALNYEQIKKDSQRVSKIKPFIDQYNWKEIDFISHKKD